MKARCRNCGAEAHIAHGDVPISALEILMLDAHAVHPWCEAHQKKVRGVLELVDDDAPETAEPIDFECKKDGAVWLVHRPRRLHFITALQFHDEHEGHGFSFAVDGVRYEPPSFSPSP